MSAKLVGFGFDLGASISNREVVGKPARVQSRASKCEPEGNFDGILAVCMSQPNLHIPLALLEFGAASPREKKFAQHRQTPLAAGLRFSHDVGNGGSLFATLIAKDLLVNHLRAVTGAIHLEQLSANQRSQLQAAVIRVGEGLDWPTAAKRDLEALRGDYAGNSQTSAALTRIISSYVAALNDDSKLAVLNQAVEGAPQELANVIPSAKRVLEQKQDLNNTLQQTRAQLQ